MMCGVSLFVYQPPEIGLGGLDLPRHTRKETAFLTWFWHAQASLCGPFWGCVIFTDAIWNSVCWIQG